MVTKKGGEVESERWYGIHHIVSKDEMGWLKKCYVGEVHDPDVVLDLQERFLHAGLYSVQVTHLGGNLVLLQASENEDFGEL